MNEAELARGAERLRLTVEAAQIGTWDWDIVRDWVIWNERNYGIFGVLNGTPVSSGLFVASIQPQDAGG